MTMENRGSKEETLYYMIEGWHGELADTDLYFHAAYRQEHPVQKGHAYTVIDGIEGKGIFAGISFAAGMNGHNTCWVEGEPKMYLDGDQYPTINYTERKIISVVLMRSEMTFYYISIRPSADYMPACMQFWVMTVRKCIMDSSAFCFIAFM